MSTWNKRAVQGALIRLDQTGMIKRFQAKKKGTENDWITCIQAMREPREEDFVNLGFRGRQTAADEPTDEQLDEDVDGDTLMRDLDVEMLENVDPEGDGGVADDTRVPPQWTPDRLLANTFFDIAMLGGSEGWDGTTIRERAVGKFWRRPTDSFMARLTENWEKMQPIPHLRHLALIRDTRVTDQKKTIHYVYRTYKNFQIVVDQGAALWKGVSKAKPKATQAKAGRPKKNMTDEQALDQWGFHKLDPTDFLRKDGSGTVSECRSAIVPPKRKNGSRWDIALSEEIGYEKPRKPMTPQFAGRSKGSFKGKPKLRFSLDDEQDTLLTPEAEQVNQTEQTDGVERTVHDGQADQPMTPRLTEEPQQDTEPDTDQNVSFQKTTPSEESRSSRPSKTLGNGPWPTAEQRVAMGLRAYGRLSKSAEKQIVAHRKKTGDPASLPDSIIEEPKERKMSPLMTKEQRIAQGLPATGRLGKEKEDEIRRERGLPIESKQNKPRYTPGPALLSKKKKIELGINPKGRMPQALMDGLRQEREDGISLDDSPSLRKYLEWLRSKKSARDASESQDTVAKQDTPAQEQSSRAVSEEEQPSPSNLAMKRKVTDGETTLQFPKRQRKKSRSPPRATPEPSPSSPSAVKVKLSSHQQSAPTEAREGPLEEHCTLAPSIEDVVMKSIETPVSRASIKQARTTAPQNHAPSPVPTPGKFSLTPANQEIHDRYTNRSAPGVYINPFAKQKIGRGRPRNAYIATFKSDRLRLFEWFGRASPPPEDASSESEDGQEDAEQSSIHLGSNLAHPTAADGSGHQPLETVTPVLRPVAGWNAINTSVQSNEVPYQSPYATASQAADIPSSPQLCQNVATRGLDCNGEATALPSKQIIHEPATAPEPQPEVETNPNDGAEAEAEGTGSSIQGVVSAISEVGIIERKIAEGAKRGGGSTVLRRYAIIREIIDICKGVYPMGGEIGRPFNILWDRRYSHLPLKKPSSSTILYDLRHMIRDPANGLKQMTFLVKNRQGPATREKKIVAYAHYDGRSPEVMRLAYNMANYSSEKSQQFFPEEIRHLVDNRSLYTPMSIPPKDQNVSLGMTIEEKKKRQAEKAMQKRADIREMKKEIKKRAADAARMAQDAQVERAASKQNPGAPHAKRTRLASLNDKTKRYRLAPVKKRVLEIVDQEIEGREDEDLSSSPDSEDERPPKALNSTDSSLSRDNSLEEDPSSDESGQEVEENLVEGSPDKTQKIPNVGIGISIGIVPFTSPLVRFYPANGTFSTEFVIPSALDGKVDATDKSKPMKRVRIAEPPAQRPRKKVRIGDVERVEMLDSEFVHSSGEASDASASSDDDEIVKEVEPKRRRKMMAKRQIGKNGLPAPTLLERLTGLTGDPNDPVYQPPVRYNRITKTRPWSERKKTQRSKKKNKGSGLSRGFDPVDEFKKLCCTLVVASSMTGEDGVVDWTIVTKVHGNERSFDVSRTKKLWSWMQTNMTTQLAEMTTTFQYCFLEAYENGKVAAIEDPETYDWVSLVRWAMRKCTYPELPLPLHREALQQFFIVESSYEALNRKDWHNEKIADRTRSHLQLQCSFAAPLHRVNTRKWSAEDKTLKARSWIRANTATPQATYDGNKAHDKLKSLGESVLVDTVGGYVDQDMLKMRKLKRHLPGRNYNFTVKLAKKYKRPFELSDFMAGVKVKKIMDAAFRASNPENRFYNISHTEEDGSVMAIMSMVSEGTINLVPKLPSVNNEFGAPLPRLSVWGFCEGDYVHRAIDRQRLFWDIHAVPTDKYQFSNPLQPSQTKSGPSTDWTTLPEPPLPGKHDPDALLPIWSSINGQTVTWPWWYRILNLVLQPLIFQPGATATDIYEHCPEHTTEMFEVELVLQWLLSVNAVAQTAGGGYIAKPSFWAAFGDKLLDQDDDWFGEHIKRNIKRHVKQQWREEYNLRFSSSQMDAAPQTDGNAEEGNEDTSEDGKGGGDEHDVGTTQQKSKESGKEHKHAQNSLLTPTSESQAEELRSRDATELDERGNAVQDPGANKQQGSESTDTTGQDVQMMDAEAIDEGDEDQDEEEDADAEGEMDEEMY